MKIVVLISASAEWQGFKRLFPHITPRLSPYGECADLALDTPALRAGKGWNLKLFHSGWGKIASAGMMQYVIDRESPDLVVNLGTCGGLEGSVRQGEVVLVERTFVYDIVELMGDPASSGDYTSTLDLIWLPEPYPYPVRRGTIASADRDLPPDKIPFLKASGAIAADWESAALAWVASRNNVRLLILRGVSDTVGGQGSEAYGDPEMFNRRAGEVMKTLFDQLPGWLNAISIATSSFRPE